MSSTFYVIGSGSALNNYTENFANATGFNSYVNVSDDAVAWSRSTTAGFGTPRNSMKMDFYNSPDGKVDDVILPPFNTTGLNDPKLKFKHINKDDYSIIKSHNVIIRNLNKLQRIPFIIKDKTNVDFAQVKFHLKKYCNYRDVYQMFKLFNEEENQIIKCINYNPPKNTHHKDQINANITAFNNLRF